MTYLYYIVANHQRMNINSWNSLFNHIFDGTHTQWIATAISCWVQENNVTCNKIITTILVNYSLGGEYLGLHIKSASLYLQVQNNLTNRQHSFTSLLKLHFSYLTRLQAAGYQIQPAGPPPEIRIQPISMATTGMTGKTSNSSLAPQPANTQHKGHIKAKSIFPV